MMGTPNSQRDTFAIPSRKSLLLLRVPESVPVTFPAFFIFTPWLI